MRVGEDQGLAPAPTSCCFPHHVQEQTAPACVPAGMSTHPKSADPGQPSNVEKRPDDWITGDESMTGAQASYLKTLCEEAGEPFDPNLSKADASRRIDALQAKTGRGRDH